MSGFFILSIFSILFFLLWDLEVTPILIVADDIAGAATISNVIILVTKTIIESVIPFHH